MANEEAAPPAVEEGNLSLLASEMFGENFIGEVKKEEPVVEAVAEQPPETQEIEEPVAEEPPPADDAAPVKQEAEEQSISSVSELVEHFELDNEWFDGLNVNVKVDGDDSSVALSELRASYQMNLAADKRLDEAKSRAKAVNQELAQKSSQLEAQFQTVAKLVENAESVLNEDSKSINWAELRQNDPAEYSAKKSDVSERRTKLDAMKQEAMNAYQKSHESQQAEALVNFNQTVVSEHAKLLERLPEWSDQDKASAEKSKLSEYLLSQGFTEQDVAGASDHRLIIIARKAMLFDDNKADNVAKKKVAKVPKVLKSGAQKSQDQISAESLEKAHARLRKSNSIEDAYKLMKLKRGT